MTVPDRIWARRKPTRNMIGKNVERGEVREWCEEILPQVAVVTGHKQYLASTPAREKAEELLELVKKHARWADGIRGAVETNQVADKDVRGLAIAMRDEMRALITSIEGETGE